MPETSSSDVISPIQKMELRRIVNDLITERINILKSYAKVFLFGVAGFLLLGITWQQFRYFLFERAYPPEHVYEQLKEKVRTDSDLRQTIATDISRLLGERVDSGYSKVVLFGAGTPFREGDNILQFYARDKQRVILSVKALGSPGATFTVSVDRKPVATIGGPQQGAAYPFPYQAFADITSDLGQGATSHATDPYANAKNNQLNIHTVSVMPVVIGPSEYATFELLVIVRNEA